MYNASNGFSLIIYLIRSVERYQESVPCEGEGIQRYWTQSVVNPSTEQRQHQTEELGAFYYRKILMQTFLKRFR